MEEDCDLPRGSLGVLLILHSVVEVQFLMCKFELHAWLFFKAF